MVSVRVRCEGESLWVCVEESGVLCDVSGAPRGVNECTGRARHSEWE